MDKIPSKWPQDSKNKEFSGPLTLNCHHPSSTVCSGQNIFENIKNHFQFSPKGPDEIFKFQLLTFKKCLYKRLQVAV